MVGFLDWLAAADLELNSLSKNWQHQNFRLALRLAWFRFVVRLIKGYPTEMGKVAYSESSARF